jgi:beta-lactamase regulating signal transducer with metallopeptidase domain
MDRFFSTGLLEILGWSLFDSLWQMGLLWLVYVILTANGKRFSPETRHSLALLSLAGGTIWFFISIVLNIANPGLMSGGISDFIEERLTFITSLKPLMDGAVQWISVLYLSILPFLFIRLFLQFRSTRILQNANLQKAPPQIRTFVKSVAVHMGIKKEVRLWLSDLVDTPLTLGFMRPIILLPVAAINNLSITQVQAIVLHELNHIRRNDYLINLLSTSAGIVFFFNPFAKTLIGTIRREREHSCDDMVLQFEYDARQYASALLMLERSRVPRHALAMQATGKCHHQLLNRVKRILRNETVVPPVSQKMTLLLATSLLVMAVGIYEPARKIVKEIIVAPTETREFAFTQTPVAEPEATPEKTSSSATKEPPVVSQNDHVTHGLAAEILEEITERISEAALEQIEEHQADIVRFASEAAESAEFSIHEEEPVHIPVTADHPYVPSQSFSFKLQEDTAYPKKMIITFSDKQARESREKALRGLEEVNWQQLEKQLRQQGQNIDLLKLQAELKKAISDIDWKKINEEMESSLDAATDAMTETQEELRRQLTEFNEQRAEKQKQLKKTREKIVEERINECKTSKKIVEI